MFTGIIEEIGKIKSVKKGAHSSVLEIEGKVIFDDLHLGDSVAVNGVCLTVTSFSHTIFSAEVMHETLNRSSLGALKNGSAVNLERAMSANGRFGGHIVSGHIDGTGHVTNIRQDGVATWYTIGASEAILHYIVEKGSITIDGISLTVAAVSEKDFSVSIITFTKGATTLSDRKVGDVVNLENDVVGKYIEKFMRPEPSKQASNITPEFLAKFGY